MHSRQFETAVLRATVQPMQGATPYVRYGNLFVILTVLLLMGWGIYRRLR